MGIGNSSCFRSHSSELSDEAFDDRVASDFLADVVVLSAASVDGLAQMDPAKSSFLLLALFGALRSRRSDELPTSLNNSFVGTLPHEVAPPRVNFEVFRQACRNFRTDTQRLTDMFPYTAEEKTWHHLQTGVNSRIAVLCEKYGAETHSLQISSSRESVIQPEVEASVVNPTTARERRWAILVGAGSPEDLRQDSEEPFKPFAAAYKNCLTMGYYLQTQCEFPVKNTTLLANFFGENTDIDTEIQRWWGKDTSASQLQGKVVKPPTKKNIEEAVNAVAQRCHQGDSVVFYFNGHGERKGACCCYGRVEAEEYIVPSDEELLSNNDMLGLVQGFKEGVRVTMIMDSCHSGDFLKLPYQFKYNDGDPFVDRNKEFFLQHAGGCCLVGTGLAGGVAAHHSVGQKNEDDGKPESDAKENEKKTSQKQQNPPSMLPFAVDSATGVRDTRFKEDIEPFDVDPDGDIEDDDIEDDDEQEDAEDE